MASINDFLFDELLIKIFHYLSYEERLACRIVCQRWLQLLLTDFQFRNDRQLFLSNCFIHPDYPPASVLLKSEFSYETLTISKSALKWLCYKSDAAPFFKFLGQSVVKIQVTDFGVDKDTFKIFKEFPLIKSLTMTEGTSFKVNDLPDEAFPSLEHLEVRKLTNICNILDLLHVAPHLKSLNFRESDNWEDKSHESIVKKFKEAHPHLIQSYVGASTRSGEQSNVSEELLKSQNIRRVIYYHCQNESFLENINQIPSIKEIFLTCMDFPQVTMTNLTVLKLICRTLPDFGPMEPLIYLETFTLEVVHDCSCCFRHQPLNLERLTSFELTINNKNDCNDCFVAISESFPNLRKFHLSTMTLRSSLLRLSFTWSHLKKLLIRSPTVFCGIPVANELTNLAVCHKLTHLSLGNNVIIDKNAIKHLCRVCPKLVWLKFHVESTSPSIVTIMEEVLISLPKLAVLLIHPSEVSFFNVTEEEASLILGIIIKYGKNLRDLIIPTHYKTNHNHAMKLLFEKMPYLSFVQMKEMDSRRYGYVMSRVKYVETTRLTRSNK
ncbi:uncharacterized protein LOC134831053 [Culicoides brevitarsis]|uniref:uncharacterized protein LOC134831053 n=1 Tax=Culicoides brevitarsis TaxID=469753 RepID=UPI00307B59A5